MLAGLDPAFQSPGEDSLLPDEYLCRDRVESRRSSFSPLARIHYSLTVPSDPQVTTLVIEFQSPGEDSLLPDEEIHCGTS